ncbi:MAG: hypothetical protein AAB972_01850 [Patescibacteria group bacterium]
MKNRHTREQSMNSIVLKRVAQVGEGVLNAFLPRGHSETHMMRAMLGIDSRRHISRKTFSTTLSRLKKDGLVERSGTMRCALWCLTEAGKRSLEKDRIITSDRAKKEDGIGRLVIFDIPEQERKKRDTIRSELICADFKQLQKSVWIGYRPLPQAFIVLLDDLRLKGKVHIFSIQNEGTIMDD